MIGAAALIRDQAGRVLLVRQTYHRHEVWVPPGGWLGRGETPRQTAARETYEEVGLRVAVGPPLAVGTGAYGQINILFDCRILDDREARLSDEVDRATYFPPSDLPPTYPGVRGWLREALAVHGIAADPTAPRLPFLDRGGRGDAAGPESEPCSRPPRRCG